MFFEFVKSKISQKFTKNTTQCATKKDSTHKKHGLFAQKPRLSAQKNPKKMGAALRIFLKNDFAKSKKYHFLK